MKPLTKQELTCLQWSAIGKTSWETGRILHISERTVNFHIQNACRKLGVHGRRAAVTEAMRKGLLYFDGTTPKPAKAAPGRKPSFPIKTPRRGKPSCQAPYPRVKSPLSGTLSKVTHDLTPPSPRPGSPGSGPSQLHTARH